MLKSAVTAVLLVILVSVVSHAANEIEKRLLEAARARLDAKMRRRVESSEHKELLDNYSPVRYYPVKFESDFEEETRGGPPVKSGLIADQIQTILEHHNILRRGEGAANMEVLKWNDKLAKLAQQWADRCDFEHGQPPFDPGHVGYKSLGQNLYANTDPRKTVKDGVQAWFDEKSDFHYDSLACNSGKMCGHYTQVVWGSTREVGCGLTNCTSISGMKFANYLVCNYGPPGNWQGQKPYVKGEACSMCDSGKFFCTKSLCDYSCSSPGSGGNCECKAKCGKCGSSSNDCKCQCKPGWSGVACNQPCKDNHQNCGGNPGWPASWCDSAHQFVLDNCPKLCKKCEAPSGGAVCNLKKSYHDEDSPEDRNKSDESSDERSKSDDEDSKETAAHKHSKTFHDDDDDSDRKTKPVKPHTQNKHDKKSSEDSSDEKRARSEDSSDERDSKKNHDKLDQAIAKLKHTQNKHKDSSEDSSDKKRAKSEDSSDERDSKKKHEKLDQAIAKLKHALGA